jgi:dTDP-4-dehydrorhamnose reductase
MTATKPKLLLIGASGFVGGWLSEVGRERFELFAASRQPRASAATGHRSILLDVTDSESVKSAFDVAQPDGVVLAAALADVEHCEREPATAERINVTGAQHVARECRRRGARLLYTSTDAVFDGALGGYDEVARPTPPNEYGRSKARAEDAIREILPTAAIVRYSMVLGFARREGVHSHLDRLAKTLRAGETIEVPIAEYRNPIDAPTLARLLLDLIGRDDASSVFHIGSRDKVARVELVRRISIALGCSGDLAQPIAALPPGRAKRSADSFLICRRLPELTGQAMPSCDDVIARAVATERKTG